MMSWKATKKLPRRVRQARKAARIVKSGAFVGAGIGLGLGAAAYLLRQRRMIRLDRQVVVITGGSRGLGLALAEECAKQGAHVAICARESEELDTAKRQIESRFGGDVHTGVCDVSNNDEVGAFLTGVLSRFGRVDVLINNAGVISVGPAESQTLTDYQEAMDVMYWGMVYPTLQVLPHMKARRGGRIVNITSIGGKIAVPHLLPYDAAKFAAVGFSEGMRSELLKEGILVTTICPGLMRTGSHLNANFKGQHRKEYTWFSLGATLPLISIDARRAARKIVSAMRAGEAEVILTPQAKVAAAFHGLFPGLTADLLGLANWLMPSAPESRKERHAGRESETFVTRSFVQKMGRNAAHDLNQTAGQTYGKSLAGRALPNSDPRNAFP